MMLLCTAAMGLEREKASPPPPRDQAVTQAEAASSRREPAIKTGSPTAARESVRPEPRGIIVVPEYPIDIDIWTDRHEYEEGESIRIFFQSSRDAWVYIFNVDTRGRTHQIFPNYFDRDNFIEGGWRYSLPDRRYDFVVTGPQGRERLKIIAIPERFDHWDRRYSPNRSRPYPEIQGGPDRFLDELRRNSDQDGGSSRDYSAGDDRRIVYQSPESSDRTPAPGEMRIRRVEPVPHHRPQPPQYAVAWTSFYVFDRYGWRPGPGYPSYRTGTLILNSEPRYASVFINEEYVGRTPIELDLREGRYHVHVIKSGYNSWEKTVTIKEGRTSRYSFLMRR